jgi:hypothetical protein
MVVLADSSGEKAGLESLQVMKSLNSGLYSI